MRLSELTAYAETKYRIPEQHKWADFPGFSVLTDPKSGKWAALLMRQWDGETGTWIERCDLKCGAEPPVGTKPYLTKPFRMQKSRWVGVIFSDSTEPEVVFRLFDRALQPQQGVLISLEPLNDLHVTVNISHDKNVRISFDPETESAASEYRQTPIPFAGSASRPRREPVPERLRKALQLGRSIGNSRYERSKRFVQQAHALEDYEDDAPYAGEFFRFFPTYADLNVPQLRGYFTWRAKLRRGVCEKAPLPFVYIYVYELLNGVGTASPVDGLQKMLELEAVYPDAELGDAQLRRNLRRWMPEFCVLNDLPPEDALRVSDPVFAAQERAMTVLRHPDEHSEKALFSALCLCGGKKAESSPVLKQEPERGLRLFADAWRFAAKRQSENDQDLFTRCFGEKKQVSWYPLYNAVYYDPRFPEDRDYVLDEFRSYHRRGGFWRTEGIFRVSFECVEIRAFTHAADRLFRSYLGIKRSLREGPDELWAVPYAQAAIDADRLRLREAARESVRIDLSGLERIRQDARSTRDSLLTEDELFEPEPLPSPEPPPAAQQSAPELPPEDLQTEILRVLLRGESADRLIKAARLTPSLAADLINEALFDEFGDVVLECENDSLSVVADYKEDLSRMLGGNTNG